MLFHFGCFKYKLCSILPKSKEMFNCLLRQHFFAICKYLVLYYYTTSMEYELSCDLIGSYLHTLTSYYIDFPFTTHSKRSYYIDLPFMVDFEKFVRLSSLIFQADVANRFRRMPLTKKSCRAGTYLICHLSICRHHLFTFYD